MWEQVVGLKHSITSPTITIQFHTTWATTYICTIQTIIGR